jgi:hypothetical protein
MSTPGRRAQHFPPGIPKPKLRTRKRPMQPYLNAATFDPHADDPLLEILEADWVCIGDRNYPPQYFYSLGRYRAHEEDVERMRRAISGLPRVHAADYDILFNAVTLTWDIVKWVALPEPLGLLGARAGFTSRVVREPFDVYSIPAGRRDPSTLGELDWLFLRRFCVTTRGGDEITDYQQEQAQQRIADHEREREAAEHDLGGWMLNLLRRINEETGYGDLPPEEMARRTGTPVHEWTDLPTPED